MQFRDGNQCGLMKLAGGRERKQGLSDFIRMLLDDELLEFSWAEASAAKISHSEFQQHLKTSLLKSCCAAWGQLDCKNSIFPRVSWAPCGKIAVSGG